MTFTAAGSLTQSETTPGTSSTTLSLTTHAAGNVVLLSVVSDPSKATGVSGGGCTWVQLTTTRTLSSLFGGAGGFGNIWAGTVTGAGTATVTVTLSASANHVRMNANEFSVTAGAIALDADSFLDSAGGTSTWPSLTPAGSGELYFGYCEDAASAVAGSTAGFVYQVDGHGNGTGYCLSVSAAYAPVWGDGSQQAGVMALVKEVSPGANVPGAAAALALAAPAGSVSASSQVTGITGALSLAAPAGAVSASASPAGQVAALALAAPAGSVAAGTIVGGAIAALSLAAPTGTVNASPSVSGVTAAVAFTAAPGTVTVPGSQSVTGTVTALALSAPAGAVFSSTQGSIGILTASVYAPAAATATSSGINTTTTAG